MIDTVDSATKSAVEPAPMQDSTPTKTEISARYISQAGSTLKEFPVESVASLRPLLQANLVEGLGELLVIWVRSEARTELIELKNMVAEVAAQSNTPCKFSELSFRQEKLFYTGGLAVIVGEDFTSGDYILGLVLGVFCAGELNKLSTTVTKLWVSCRDDKRLAGKVGTKEVAQWERMSELMNETFQTRMTYVELEERTERAAEELIGLSKKVFVSIINDIEFEDRMEVLDEKIDVLQDIYELCNDRISEYSYFHQEWVLEVLIVIVLIVEIVLMTVELLK